MLKLFLVDGTDVSAAVVYPTASSALPQPAGACSGKSSAISGGVVRVCLLIGLALLAAGMAYGLLRYCGVSGVSG